MAQLWLPPLGEAVGIALVVQRSEGGWQKGRGVLGVSSALSGRGAPAGASGPL